MACIFADPAAEIRFFLVPATHQVFFRFPLVSGHAFGRHFEALLCVLGSYFGNFGVSWVAVSGFLEGPPLLSKHVAWAFSLSSEMQSFQFVFKS